jgi:hypothetical protein
LFYDGDGKEEVSLFLVERECIEKIKNVTSSNRFLSTKNIPNTADIHSTIAAFT